jgi:hypothetical protein
MMPKIQKEILACFVSVVYMMILAHSEKNVITCTGSYALRRMTKLHPVF